MSLTKQLKAAQTNKVVTPLHEAYLSRTGDVEVSQAIAEFVVKELQSKQRDRGATFSASARGTCLRQQVLAYVRHPGKQSFTSDTNAIFIHGTWTHLKWQAMGFDAGWLKEAEVSCVAPEYHLTGTIDGILYDGTGWEFKSINQRGYRYVLENGPKPEHLLQAHSYMIATGIRQWSVMYEDKDTQQWTEFVVPYTEEIADAVMDELVVVNKAVDTRTLPAPLDACTRGEGTTFKQCPYKSDCVFLPKWPRKTLRINRG